MRALIGVLGAAVLVMAGLGLWVHSRTGAAGGNSTSAELSTAADAVRDTGGETVPSFNLPTLAPYRQEWGNSIDYENFAGKKPLVINFWASWCPPCRREAPLLEAAWQKHRAKVQFIGVNFQDQEADALAFIEEFAQSFPSGADRRGDTGLDFGVFGMPTTYFVDPDGTIRAAKVGEISAGELEKKMSELLSAEGPPELTAGPDHGPGRQIP
jgi:cytochrome c biogenesis protein CcmG/thiol:disulfide interchange protein DsbE